MLRYKLVYAMKQPSLRKHLLCILILLAWHAGWQLSAVTITSAKIQIMADDASDIYLNGQMVKKMKCAPCQLQKPYIYDVPPEFFHNGKNVLTNWAFDTASGWLSISYVLTVNFDDGTDLEIVSDGSGTVFWEAGFHYPEDLKLPPEGWKEADFDDSNWKPTNLRKRGSNAGWGSILDKNGKKVPWLAKDTYGAIEQYEVHIFRDPFQVSGLPEPTALPTPTFSDTPIPSNTPLPATTTPTPPPMATPTLSLTETPPPPTATPIFTMPPTHTFPPTDTYTITYTPIPTPTPWTEVTENIEVHGRVLHRYFRFEGEYSIMERSMTDVVDKFSKLELVPGKDGAKAFGAKVTRENGQVMTFSSFRRLSWPDGEQHDNLLVPLENNRDNQALLSLSLTGEQGKDAIYIFNNFIVIPFKYIDSLEVIEGKEGFSNRTNITTMVLSLKGEDSSSEIKEDSAKPAEPSKVEFKAPALPPGAPK